jgi:hypothetical protein
MSKNWVIWICLIAAFFAWLGTTARRTRGPRAYVQILVLAALLALIPSERRDIPWSDDGTMSNLDFRQHQQWMAMTSAERWSIRLRETGSGFLIMAAAGTLSVALTRHLSRRRSAP